jgi:hypothetical protein
VSCPNKTISHLVLLGLLFCVVLVAKISAGGNDVVWRPISSAELAMKSPAVQPDADAESIFWDVWIDDKGGGITCKNYVDAINKADGHTVTLNHT